MKKSTALKLSLALPLLPVAWLLPPLGMAWTVSLPVWGFPYLAFAIGALLRCRALTVREIVKLALKAPIIVAALVALNMVIRGFLNESLEWSLAQIPFLTAMTIGVGYVYVAFALTLASLFAEPEHDSLG